MSTANTIACLLPKTCSDPCRVGAPFVANKTCPPLRSGQVFAFCLANFLLPDTCSDPTLLPPVKTLVSTIFSPTPEQLKPKTPCSSVSLRGETL